VSAAAAAAAAAAGTGPKPEPGSAAAGDGKEDPKGLFTDNLQTSGAYSAREEGLKREVKSSSFYLILFVYFCMASDSIGMMWLR
jgi:histone acetyltransferase